jgi:hypothetical protein
MVVTFPRPRRAAPPVSEDLVRHVARTEAYLDELLAGLYSRLPSDPARYPIRVGEHLIHYRRRPRSVVTGVQDKQTG